MAVARRCDICGKYFDVPEISPYRLDYEENLNLIKMHLARNPKEKHEGEDWWMVFDACEECYQSVLDYILSKKAEQGGC